MRTNEKERLDVIVSLSADLIFEYDVLTGTMYFYNQGEAENISSQEENYAENILKENTIHEDDQGILATFCEQLKAGAKQIHLELRKKYQDGEYHWIEIVAKGICNKNGQTERIIGKTGIIDERVRYRNMLTERMERDTLTGVYNYDTVRQLMKKRLGQSDFSVENFFLVINIEKLCTAYTQKGSLFVDTMLCTFADELQIRFPKSLVGRSGGEEFVVYAENSSIPELREKKRELSKHIQRIYKEMTDCIKVTCEMGITAVNKGDTYDALLLRAKSALCCATAGEDDRIRVYRKGKTPLLKSISFTPIREVSGEFRYGTDGDLILFAIELFEKIPDIRSVLRILSDRICKFYKIQDMVYLSKTEEGQAKVSYYWGSVIRGEFSQIPVNINRSEWDVILKQYDKDGISILREKDINRERDTDGKSILCVRLESGRDEHYMLFVDREKDRDWQQERAGMKRIAWIMYKRLLQMESERKELERTNYVIEHDDKTDLYNYTKFLSVAEKILKENRQKTYALIYSDFSNFQFLNETYGYVTGDKVLIEFAYALKENCENGVLYSRVTGDHFISMHEYREGIMEEYVKVCNEFCEKVNRKYNMCNLILYSGMSIIDDLKVKTAVYVDNANIARKAAKKNTLTRYKVYSEEMRQLSKRQMELAANMEKALKSGEFVMYLQPKIDLSSGRISGAEALVRWIKGDGSIIYPDEFIPLFEKNGFITKIDFEMLRQVLILQQENVTKGKPLIPISVNFSRRHQENAHYVEEVHRMMEDYQVPSEYVEIEVTESIFMDDFTVLNQNIGKLKKTGVMIAIDDFGSGYSSLNVLSKVDADVIKLDRQFLLDMESDSGEVKKNFLNTLVLMIKQLGFKVLAEGVETEEQEELLKNIGCEYAQGYLYAKPMDVADFMEFSQKYEQIC